MLTGSTWRADGARRRLRLAGPAPIGLALALAACGSPGPAASTPTTSVPKDATATGMFGRRYCELLLVQAHSTPLVADVWNTYPLNDCPEAAWQAVDLTAVAAAHGASLAIRNGPRYWAIDGLTKYSSTPLRTESLGGIAMHLDATVQLGSQATAPYVGHAVERDTVFRYRAGRRIYELHAADGATYVMQSWSQQDDPTLAEADLAGLGTRLHLPDGWTFGTRVLTRPLAIVTSSTPATVLQDDLGDSYSRES